MQLLRKIFFYMFAAIYVVSCPLIISHAFGYLYRPGERKSRIIPGLVYFHTLSQGVSEYVNDKLWEEKTPADIQALTPGKDEIKTELDGYSDCRRNHGNRDIWCLKREGSLLRVR